jgi:PTH1 family peptidyl-tRNA hydrolase
MEPETQKNKAIIGLGNPGQKYYKTRHSIGFRVLDELGNRHGAQWSLNSSGHAGGLAQTAEVMIGGNKVLLIKPQTFMNSSGRVIPGLQKQGIRADQILVVHDELEKPFGALAFKLGGSHRGHNGLRSIIEACGADFERLRFGIGRPENKEEVADYVLEPFREQEDKVEQLIMQAADMIEGKYK